MSTSLVAASSNHPALRPEAASFRADLAALMTGREHAIDDSVEEFEGVSRAFDDHPDIQVWDITVSYAAIAIGEGSTIESVFLARRGAEYLIARVNYPPYCDDEADGYCYDLSEVMTQRQALTAVRAMIRTERASLRAYLKTLSAQHSDIQKLMDMPERVAA